MFSGDRESHIGEVQLRVDGNEKKPERDTPSAAMQQRSIIIGSKSSESSLRNVVSHVSIRR